MPGDNASTAGAVTALAVPCTSVSPAAQREQLSAGKQHLVHTRSELRAPGRKLDKPWLGQNELRLPCTSSLWWQ